MIFLFNLGDFLDSMLIPGCITICFIFFWCKDMIFLMQDCSWFWVGGTVIDLYMTGLENYASTGHSSLVALVVRDDIQFLFCEVDCVYIQFKKYIIYHTIEGIAKCSMTVLKGGCNGMHYFQRSHITPPPHFFILSFSRIKHGQLHRQSSNFLKATVSIR